VATARAMGAMSSMAAALEIIFNPILGRLSDRYGRRPFLIAAPLMTAFVHTLVAMFPSGPYAMGVMFLDRAVSGSMIFAFTNPLQAAVADTFTGQAMAEKASMIGGCLGLGAAIGPFIGAKLGGARSFLASAGTFALVAAYVAASVPETLAENKRKPFSLADSNPLCCLKLFRQNKILSRLTMATGLQSFADNVNSYDINNLYLTGVLGYEPAQLGNYAMSYGFTQILGGKFGQLQIRSVGLKTHTLLSNIAMSLSMCAFGMAKSSKHLAVALFFVMFSHQRNAAIAAWTKEHAARAGLGNAEAVAAATNMTAYIKVVAPLLYSNIYAAFTTKGRNWPGAPYFLIAFLSCLSQLTFQSVDADPEQQSTSPRKKIM